jgi:hypothetical protein
MLVSSTIFCQHFAKILQHFSPFFRLLPAFSEMFQHFYFEEMLVPQIFFVNILKMLQYFLEMLDNTFFSKKFNILTHFS